MSHDGAPAFQRILIKVSGESLMGSLDYGTDPARLGAVAEQIKVVHALDLVRDRRDALGIGPVLEVAHERLPGQLEEDALEGGPPHGG